MNWGYGSAATCLAWDRRGEERGREQKREEGKHVYGEGRGNREEKRGSTLSENCHVTWD